MYFVSIIFVLMFSVFQMTIGRKKNKRREIKNNKRKKKTLTATIEQPN